MYGLGISAYYHDSAAVLLHDGKVIAAAEEERFSRIKHDNSFPENAIYFCLRSAGISADELEYVAYYEKPLRKFERILEQFVETYPRSLRPFVKGIPEWVSEKLSVEKKIRSTLGFSGKVHFIPHHVSHAASTFYPSPFREATIVTIDGVGEHQTTGIWRGSESGIEPLCAINFPHSLGLLYSTFTAFLGFRVNSDEYKVMGLAAYGKPVYAEHIYKMVDVRDDGSFALNMQYFSFRDRFCMWSSHFEKLFGAPRSSKNAVTQREKDIAASIQQVLEDTYFKILTHAHKITGSANVCISGGVALNALANGKIHEQTPFKHVYIFGPAGDSGAALGAALYVYHGILKHADRSAIAELSWGSSYTSEEIESVLKEKELLYTKHSTESELLDETANLLVKDQVVGWFQGAMEFGPRALGARSILARPASADMKAKVNAVKRREEFRPFGGSVPEESLGEYVASPQGEHTFPFMNFCFQAREDGKDAIAAIVHEDGSVRVQTVGDGGRYRALLERIHTKTGVPVLLNTSFNTQGEPIVETPSQAVDVFLSSEMDALVIGDCIVRKI